MNIFSKRKEGTELQHSENIPSKQKTSKRYGFFRKCTITKIQQEKSSKGQQQHERCTAVKECPKAKFEQNKVVNSRQVHKKNSHYEGNVEADFSFIKRQKNAEKVMREEFVVAVSEKLSKLKRDREVREKLQDCLKDFKPYISKPGQQCRRRCARHIVENEGHCVNTKYSVHWEDYILKENRPLRKCQFAEVQRNENFKRIDQNHFNQRNLRENKCPDIYFKQLDNQSQAINKTHKVLWKNNNLRNDTSSSFTSPVRSRNTRTRTRNSSRTFTVVGFSYGTDSIPFVTRIEGKRITLSQFKALINKKEKYRFFFKTCRRDFGTEMVYEEVKEDEEIIPLWDGKIFAILEKIVN